MRRAARWLALCTLCAVANLAYPAATFQIRNVDGAGEGLNDNALFTPEGGNTAPTLGEARRRVLDEAARIWGLLLTSTVPIVVDAAFDPLPCSDSSGTLGAARPTLLYRNPSGPQPNTYYPSALADALSGSNLNDQSPGSTGVSTSSTACAHCTLGASRQSGRWASGVRPTSITTASTMSPPRARPNSPPSPRSTGASGEACNRRWITQVTSRHTTSVATKAMTQPAVPRAAVESDSPSTACPTGKP